MFRNELEKEESVERESMINTIAKILQEEIVTKEKIEKVKKNVAQLEERKKKHENLLPMIQKLEDDCIDATTESIG